MTASRPIPRIVAASFWAWLAGAALLGVAAVTLFVNSAASGVDKVGMPMLAGLCLALGGLIAWWAVRLRSGRRSSREMLTTLALIGGVPLLFRGVAVLWVVSAVLIAAAAVLWLPSANRFFGPRKTARARSGS